MIDQATKLLKQLDARVTADYNRERISEVQANDLFVFNKEIIEAHFGVELPLSRIKVG